LDSQLAVQAHVSLDKAEIGEERMVGV